MLYFYSVLEVKTILFYMSLYYRIDLGGLLEDEFV